MLSLSSDMALISNFFSPSLDDEKESDIWSVVSRSLTQNERAEERDSFKLRAIKCELMKMQDELKDLEIHLKTLANYYHHINCLFEELETNRHS